jgi:hypothetical protein
MSSYKRRANVLIVMFSMVVLAITAACGSGSSGGASSNQLEKVADFDRILSIEDVQAIGWKLGKTYDVDGLDGADAAYVGFWNLPDIGSLNYEIRVYPSHQAAIEQGAPFAEDASGVGASMNAEEAMWGEGVRDRRVIVGGGSRGSQNPRYGDFVILGNLVILCEGRNAEHSLDQCAPFIALIRGEGA